MSNLNNQPVPVCPSSSPQTNKQGVSIYIPPAFPVTPLPKCQIERYRCSLDVENHLVKKSLPHNTNAGNNVDECNNVDRYNNIDVYNSVDGCSNVDADNNVGTCGQLSACPVPSPLVPVSNAYSSLETYDQFSTQPGYSLAPVSNTCPVECNQFPCCTISDTPANPVSNKPNSSAEISLLKKGLSFVPTP